MLRVTVLEEEIEFLRQESDSILPPHIRKTLADQKLLIENLQEELGVHKFDLKHANGEIKTLGTENKRLMLMTTTGDDGSLFAFLVSYIPCQLCTVGDKF